MTRFLTGISALVLTSAPISVHAQDRWTLEILPGAAFSTENLRDATLIPVLVSKGTFSRLNSRELDRNRMPGVNRHRSSEFVLTPMCLPILA
jgi:hypothetical protein